MNISRRVLRLLPLSWIGLQTKSLQGWLILLGLSVGLWYFPTWVRGLVDRGPQSTDGFTLAACFVGLTFYLLWKQRKKLAALSATEEDKLLGYLFILCGALLFPFCQFAIWSQALLWLTVLAGIALCVWGSHCFTQHPLLCTVAAATVYPQPGIAAQLVWQAITPYQFLERLMAQAGAAALSLFGWQATAVESFVTFPRGAVNVDWGCNGFDMALTMIVGGLVLGMLLQQGWLNTTGFIVLGVIAALIFNVPRVMLLAIASVYWGQEAFDFWHGPWGGQIFSGLLFTAFYYVVMGMVRTRPSM
ncbi:MAG: cyanoexosortase C [Cyanobacteria bacterium P01_D01_bin.105]